MSDRMITYLFAYKKKKKQTLGQVWATFFKQEIWLIIKLIHTKKKKIIKDKFLLITTEDHMYKHLP